MFIAYHGLVSYSLLLYLGYINITHCLQPPCLQGFGSICFLLCAHSRLMGVQLDSRWVLIYVFELFLFFLVVVQIFPIIPYLTPSFLLLLIFALYYAQTLCKFSMPIMPTKYCVFWYSYYILPSFSLIQILDESSLLTSTLSEVIDWILC